MGILVAEDLVVAEGEVRTYPYNTDNGVAAALDLYASLINHGEMRFQAGFGDFQNFMRFNTSNAQITNTGTITAIAPTVEYLRVLFAPSSGPGLFNSGTIVAEAHVNAIGYESTDFGVAVTNTAAGSIRMTAQGEAVCFYFANGGSVTNAGEIIASGSSDWAKACAISLPMGRGTIVNSGLIQAIDKTASPNAVAISLGGYSNPTTIVNSGTIRGDYAVQEINPNHNFTRVTIDNTGPIEGKILLTEGTAIIRNAGQIVGDVDLGVHPDVYDGRGGTIAGTVFGRAGTDLLIGGAGRDTLDGGDDNDILFGAGGDTLIGGTGADTFVYTTITPGAPPEVITGFESGLDRIDLRALSPSSVTISGSTITAVTPSGTLTIQVSGTVALTDILTAGPAVPNGSNSDTLVAGPGGEALIGGSYGDLLIGGAGNDRLAGGPGDPLSAFGNLMWGGAGDDTYIVSDYSDIILEDSNAGYDTIELAGGSYVMPDNVERMIGGGGDGNALDNVMVGSSGVDQIRGHGGSDTIDGGAGNDHLSGDEGADVLTGGAGSDEFFGTAAQLNGDTITDLAPGDRIRISNADPANFTFALNGTTLTFTGGSLTLSNAPIRPLFVRPASEGGVEVFLLPLDPQNDFNGDGRSDILWRNDDGTIADWLGSATGGFTINDSSLTPQSTGQTIAGTGDFSGDGRDEILWRGTDGSVSIWFSNPAGAFPATPDNGSGAAVLPPTRVQVAQIPLSWQIAGIGDFNGDGLDDLLWRSETGALSDWLANGYATFAINDANAFREVPTSWHVAGVGDFNGDGRDDILWRSDSGALSNWLGQANGGFIINDANALTGVPTSWHVVGTGDFNGDGRDDILWRSDTGALSNWLGQANGGFIVNDANAFSQVPTDWHVAAIGDYDGDGRDDILWRNESGALSNWLGTAAGGFVNNDVHALGGAPTNWHVQPAELLV